MSMRMLKKSQKLLYKNLNQYVKCVCVDVDAREGGEGVNLARVVRAGIMRAPTMTQGLGCLNAVSGLDRP